LKKLCEMLANMFVENDLPFEVVEHPTFVKLLKELSPTFTP